MREIWESGDLIVEVDQVQFKVSSHVLCLLSDKLASMIARIKNGGKLFNLELPDKGADAFGYIMNVAHNKPGVLPCDFSCRDVENMADMCERYGLHAFFRWHGGLYGKCLPWMRSTFMRVEVKLKTAWIFGNLDIFVAAWDELMDNLHADARGNVYRESIDLEKLLNISDTALVYSKVLVKLEDEIPPTVKTSIVSTLKRRMTDLRSADVFKILFDKMMESQAAVAPGGDGEALCRPFREQNLGQLILIAQETGYVASAFPIKRSQQYIHVFDENVDSELQWLKAWVRKISLKPCACHCEVQLWTAVHEHFKASKLHLPTELREHFNPGPVSRKRGRDAG